MATSNHLPNQLLMLSFGLKAYKLYLEDSVGLSRTHRTTIRPLRYQYMFLKKQTRTRDNSPGHL